jgi:hypothetical protein
MDKRAMANIHMIADDRWKIAAVDVNAAIILNIGALTNGNEIIITTQSHLMPDGAVLADAHRANDCSGLGDISTIIDFRVMI